MTPVEVGLYDSEYAEIRSGLSAADLVVSTWSSNLYEGAKIRLRDESEEDETGHDGAGREQEGMPKPGVPGEKPAEDGRHEAPESDAEKSSSLETAGQKTASAGLASSQNQTVCCHNSSLSQKA